MASAGRPRAFGSSRTDDANDATILTKTVVDLHYITFCMIHSPHFLDFL